MTTRGLLIALIALIVLGGALALWMSFGTAPQQNQGIACTTEAKQCPDGSYVGRTGPNCEFTTCPAATSTGGQTDGGGFAEYHSGIQGTVILGPTCPVERTPPDPQCADKPYATQISVARTVDPTHPIATAQSDSQGVFEVTLSPGDYIVSAAGGKMLPRCSSADATVAPNAYVSVAISCDTGIR